MSPRHVALVAAREVREALRSRWFVVAALSFLGLSLALSALGLAGAERAGFAGFDRTSASLLNLALLFVPLLALTLGGLAIAGELEDGSLAMLLAQPVTRTEVYLGKYLGLLAALSAAIAAGFGATAVLVGLRTGAGVASLRPYLGLVAAMLLLGAATLAIGTWLSASLGSRARVVGGAFAAWIVLVYVSDLGTIGLAIARALRPGQVFALALVNPVEQARVLGTLLLTDRLEVLGPAGIFGLDRFGPGGTAAVLVSTLLAASATALAAGWFPFRKVVVS